MGKINSLEDASQEEIERHNDVCAICYQEMSVAKITRCRHMFHSICLRKWLYMQVNVLAVSQIQSGNLFGRELQSFETFLDSYG